MLLHDRVALRRNTLEEVFGDGRVGTVQRLDEVYSRRSAYMVGREPHNDMHTDVGVWALRALVEALES